MKTIKFLLVMLFSITVAACSGSGSTSTGGTIPPAPTVPSAPTISSVTAGNAQATVSFTTPVSNGGSAITGYTVVSNPAGGVDSHASSKNLTHIITGLTNGVPYTFTVTATNSVGRSPASVASSSVTPVIPVGATVPGAPSIGTAIAGNTQVTVVFTAPVSNGGTPITSYTATCGTISIIGIASPIVVTGLTSGTAYTCTVTATNGVGTGAPSVASNSVTPALRLADAPGTLNDTGQTLCYNNTAEITCASTGTHPRQDAFFGRDANIALTKIGAGAAGFDFTKVCFNGSLNCAGAASNAAAPLATEWACTKDNHTNLIWSLQGGADNWNNATDPSNAELAANHALAANTAARCGFNTGWRLPTRRELLSIVHNGTFNPSNPSIDTNYFPGTLRNFYWSIDTYAPIPVKAWLVNFVHGGTQANDKIDSVQVRLVRSGP